MFYFRYRRFHLKYTSDRLIFILFLTNIQRIWILQGKKIDWQKVLLSLGCIINHVKMQSGICEANQWGHYNHIFCYFLLFSWLRVFNPLLKYLWLWIFCMRRHPSLPELWKKNIQMILLRMVIFLWMNILE